MAKPVRGSGVNSPPFVLPSGAKDNPSDLEKINKTYESQKVKLEPTTASLCQMEDCSKRIPVSLRDVVCKCKKVFCLVHRLPEEHECSFDWKQDGRAQLAKRLIDGSPKPKHSSIHGFGNNFAF